MICPKCHFDCPKEFDFCPKCATPLQLTCPQCGFRASADFAFCPKCATALAAPAVAAERDAQAMLQHAIQRLIPKELAERLQATRGQVGTERRLVTILFCDVKDSTARAASMDPEDVLDIVNGAFEVLIPAIYRYEGTLAQLLGDAILAFFGAPIAHEDDPERAIRAGLEITAEAQRYAERLKAERGIAGFGVRVGINTGLVVVGEVGADLRVGYTAVGDTINMAARMEQNAPVGGILISHDTYRHVRGVFDVEPQEPLLVKGKAEPLQTYLVERAKARAWRVGMRGVEGIETHMVGREVELLALQRAFEDVLEDRETRVVTVSGEAGVGKTRLLDEFQNWAELRPEHYWLFKGRAAAVAQTVPYHLLRDLFAYRFDILDSDSAATALDKFRAGMRGFLEPEKADLVGQLVGFDFAAAGSEAVRALLGSPNFGQLATAYSAQYLRGLLARQPLVMLLEDAQWADDSSLDLVAHWVSEMPNSRLLVVAAARPGLYERRPNWGEGQEAYSRLDLKPLSRRATRALVEEILQKAQEVPDALRQLVVEGAEGNPYYVEELIKMLIEDGVIVRPSAAASGAEEHWHIELERLAEVHVPPTLMGVLQARLDALPAAEKAVLQRASVVGRSFWDRLVGELAADDAQAGDISGLLAALRDRELVFQRERSAFADTTEYTFKHSILRDVTYETVLLKLRRRYHAQVARWLEANAGERLGEYLGLTAQHYELAGDRAKAAEYLRRSGEEALKVNAFRDAAATFARALELVPEDGTSERARLMVLLGQAQMPLGEFAEASRQFEVALELARTAGELSIEASALNGLGEVAWRQGQWEASQRSLLEALALAQGRGDRPGQALALQHLARVSWLRGDYEQTARWAQQSLELYEQLGDRQGLISARNEMGIACFMQKHYDQGRRLLSANLALAEEMGDRFRIAQALNNLGEVSREQGAYDEARACNERAAALDEEIGDRRGSAIAWGNLGIVCVLQGKEDAAWAHLRRALRETVAIRDTPHAVANLVWVARLQASRGQGERAAELLGLALRHPASYSEAERDAEPVLAELCAALGAEALEAALARGAKLDLDAVVEEILASESTG